MADENRKADVLRAEDIIPGAETGDESEGKEVREVPKFDLAGQIMAEHRRATADRRKGPGAGAVKEEVGRVERVGSRRMVVATPKPDEIIREIVARDIRRFCGEDA